jgi:CSLREA domain-containing protein
MRSAPARLAAAAASVTALALLLPGQALGAVITVGNRSDELTGGNGCSLREAISAANNNNAGPGGDCTPGDASGTDFIVLPAGQPYTLTIHNHTGVTSEDNNATGDLDVTSNIEIDGGGSSTTKIDATGLGDRVLDMRSGTVTLIDLTVTGGHAPDGAAGAAGPDRAPGLPQSQAASVGGNGGDGDSGGGIANAGTLTLTRVAVAGNRSGAGGAGGAGGKGSDESAAGTGAGGPSTGGAAGSAGVGGGIYNVGTLALVDSVVSGNRTGTGGKGGAGGSAGSGRGGASSDDGGDSTGGDGGFGGTGAGIYQGAGRTTVTGTAVTLNAAGAGGAGGAGGTGGAGGNASGAGSGGTGGQSTGGAGRDGAGGGGVEVQGGDLTVVDSRILGNRAGDGGAGGTGGTGGLGGSTGPSMDRLAGGVSTGGHGGAGGGDAGVASAGTNQSVSSTTIASNLAGAGGAGGSGGTGGLGGPHDLQSGSSAGGDGGRGGDVGGLGLFGNNVDFMRNLTIASNRAGTGGAGGAAGSGPTGKTPGHGGNGGDAGGLKVVSNITYDLQSSTVALNAAGAGGSPGGTAGTTGGVLASNSAQLHVDETILASNTPSNCSGNVTTVEGLDIVFPSSGSCLTSAMNADPELGPLQDNGGPAPTMGLTAGSPAIDQAPPPSSGLSLCLTLDERGVTRPVGARCDLGAVERSAPSATGGAATNIGFTTVHLVGLANAGGLPASFRFRWGKSNAYGHATPSTPAGSGPTPGGVAADVTGLQPNTLYHFQFEVTNPDGTAADIDRTFRTKATPDHTPPHLRLSGPHTQKLARTVTVTATSNEVCTVAGGGTLVVQPAGGGKAKTFRLGGATDELGSGGSTVLALAVPKAARSAAATALAGGGSATAHLNVTATDESKNHVTKHRRVKLVRAKTRATSVIGAGR